MKGCRIGAVLSALAAFFVSAPGEAGTNPVPGIIYVPPVGPAARSTIPPATGTIVTPTTPTVPPVPTLGRSTITIPGASGPGLPSTLNPATARPCGRGAKAAGTIPGNAGIVTAPGSNPNNVGTGVPVLPPLRSPGGDDTTTNPSVRPGIPGSC